MVGEKKIFSFFMGLREKKGIQTSRDFQLLITKAEEKKKIFCQCILKGGKLSISRDSNKGPRGWF